MRHKEALAIVGMAVVGAGGHAAMQFDTEAAARALAITAKTCGQTYDRPAYRNRGGGGETVGAPALLTDYEIPALAEASDNTISLTATRGGFVGRVITRQTLGCLGEGWVPGGESVDTSGLSVGDPEGLLKGYAKLEESRGHNFDASSVIAFGIIGMFGGIMLASELEKRERRKRHVS